MTDRELKLCPFCGGEAKIHPAHYGCYVSCNDCEAETRVERFESDAIAAWNTRTDAPRPERINLYDRLELVNKARKTAIMDFADRLYEHKCSYDLDNYHSFEAVDVDDIGEVVREFLGEDYDE